VTEKDYGKACALNRVFVLKSIEASIEEEFVLPQVYPHTSDGIWSILMGILA
jgi:hypothetical protein